MNRRLIWIDNLKAYGVILVIIGHSIVQPITYEYSALLMKLIYSFHMPLFFFISGFLFSSKARGNYFGRKWKSLLLPYFIFQIISVLFINAFYYVTTGQLERDPISTILSIFYLNGNVGWNAPLWFLIVLAIMDILFYFFNKLKKHGWLQFFLVVVSCIIGWQLSQTGIKYPLGLQIVFSCFIFYYLGNLTKKYRIMKRLSRHLGVYFSIVIASGGFLVASMLWLNGTRFVSLYDNYFGTSYALFLVTALCGILFSFLIFQMIYGLNILTVLGRQSILLLGTQYFLLLTFDKIGHILGIYSGTAFYLYVKVSLVLLTYLIALYTWQKRKSENRMAILKPS
ncbi:acyltransferase family protein [Listeria booriae]|uniref:acyltransferase family protein n=1 Tax=Listeria booriae TaxID=1552123 RepID=UPI0016248C17|nr:acyltransferase family protein [Listeria booriae]MBC2315972.1 acyltransferase family protein [Listeria booriae]